jgi:hypothetical protein
VTHAPAAPPRPAAGPVTLVEVDRSSRAVLSNLGQLYRYDLADAYGHLPNDDGTFNNRRLDMLLRMFPGPWRIAFQRYNPGAERFWTQVATDLVGAAWTLADDEPVEGRPPDTWLSFRTGADLS